MTLVAHALGPVLVEFRRIDDQQAGVGLAADARRHLRDMLLPRAVTAFAADAQFKKWRLFEAIRVPVAHRSGTSGVTLDTAVTHSTVEALPRVLVVSGRERPLLRLDVPGDRGLEQNPVAIDHIRTGGAAGPDGILDVDRLFIDLTGRRHRS